MQISANNVNLLELTHLPFSEQKTAKLLAATSSVGSEARVK